MSSSSSIISESGKVGAEFRLGLDEGEWDLADASPTRWNCADSGGQEF